VVHYSEIKQTHMHILSLLTRGGSSVALPHVPKCQSCINLANTESATIQHWQQGFSACREFLLFITVSDEAFRLFISNECLQ